MVLCDGGAWFCWSIIPLNECCRGVSLPSEVYFRLKSPMLELLLMQSLTKASSNSLLSKWLRYSCNVQKGGQEIFAILVRAGVFVGKRHPNICDWDCKQALKGMMPWVHTQTQFPASDPSSCSCDFWGLHGLASASCREERLHVPCAASFSTQDSLILFVFGSMENLPESGSGSIDSVILQWTLLSPSWVCRWNLPFCSLLSF